MRLEISIALKLSLAVGLCDGKRVHPVGSHGNFTVQPASTDPASVKRIIIVSSAHLDLGFNDFWGDTHDPFMTTGIIQRHWDLYYQRAIDTQVALAADPKAKQLLAKDSIPYSYMAQPFVA